MKKFHYYLYFKDGHYLLVDRFNNIIHSTIDFRSMYVFIRERKRIFEFNDIKLKSMLLSEFFRDYVTFEDYRGSNRL